MERIISEEDRIRRAEEIATRRRGTIPVKNINVKNNKKTMSMFTKVFIQTVTSMCIFGIIYLLMINNNSIIQDIRNIMSKDINIEQLYENGSKQIGYVIEWFDGFIKNLSSNDTTNNEQVEEDNNIISENSQSTNIINESNIINIIENTAEATGIGGSDENISLSQDEQDIAYIKENVSLIVPVVGTVTSKYGKRTPTEIISENHAGLDIGANEGTEIVAAMEGTVELVSSYGDYGNHLKITNGEISTMYAHCKVICVNQGDYVSQGQKIAEVGNTGRTTGPHLHLEIARNGRTIDPQAVIEI